jgi:hypothetical protein
MKPLPDISTNYLNETFVFYPSLVDAENDTNAFTAAEALVFENRTETIDTVWARAISSENCYRIAEVTYYRVYHWTAFCF